MSEKFIDIVASPKMMPEIVRLAETHGIDVSQPMALESIADALDAPLGIDEIRQVLEVITLVAATGASVLEFLNAVKSLLSKSEEEDGSDPMALVLETTSRREIGKVTKSADISDFEV